MESIKDYAKQFNQLTTGSTGAESESVHVTSAHEESLPAELQKSAHLQMQLLALQEQMQLLVTKVATTEDEKATMLQAAQ